MHALAKIIKTDDLTTLQNTLTSLEEQGKVYFNEDENKYQPFPKQYKIVTIETGKKGFYYIRNKDSIYPLKDEETIGILPFDKVILEKTKDGFNIIKVLKRIAFGFRSFRRFKARIMICKGLVKINRKKANAPALAP